MEGEEIGSRNEFVPSFSDIWRLQRLTCCRRYIHWTQDVPDQRAIVRQYMKYEHEIRSPHNAVQLTLRALQFANTTPKGPTYMVASREALERETPHPTSEGNVKPTQQAIKNLAVEPMGLMPSATEELATALASAEKPLIVTSYVGQTVAGFEALRDLAELLAIPVHENAPITNNFPTTSFLHQGHQWNGGGQLPALAEADVVLVVDSDIPWIPVQSKPSDSARVFHIDSDPLKTTMTLWCLPCEKRWQCDSSVALRQLYDHLKCTSLVQEAQSRISARIDLLEKRWEQRKDRLLEAETSPSDGSVTVPYFMARFRKATASLSIIGLNESTTNLPNVADHLGHSEAQTLIGSGGGGLGWWSGAAVGASLALQSQGRADKTLLTAFIGDGTFMFGVPSSAYWMARKYNTPFLTVVWNNGGWAAPRAACLRVHGELADQHTKEDLTESLGVGLTPSVGFGKIAEGAGDAWWRVVENTRDVDAIVEEAVAVVTNGRCAVVEVRLKQI
jgi:acetolactate synthase-1/2/3 large subunit